MHIIEGLFLGFASILLIGPVVFVLINASTLKGLKFGLAVAFGIIIGDIIYTIICYNSLSFFLENKSFNEYIGYIGFILLFVLGVNYIFKKQAATFQVSKKGDFIKSFVNGFSINFFNPFVLAVWLSVVNYAKTNHQENQISFLVAALCGIFIIDIVKVILSKKLFKFVQSKKLELFYKFSGFIMLGFSFRILWFLVK